MWSFNNGYIYDNALAITEYNRNWPYILGTAVKWKHYNILVEYID
jgi:hypothetical protein